MAFDGTARVPLYRFPKRSLLVLVVLAVLVLALFLGEQIYLSSMERNWKNLSSDEERELAGYIQSEFSSYEREALSFVKSVANLPELKPSTGIEADGRRNFEVLLAHQLPELSLELFDSQKHLVGWSGTRGPSIDTGKLGSEAKSFVIDGAIYSYLVVAVPIKAGRSVTGFVVGKSLFEVNYLINNRFINSSAFTSAFT